MNGPSSLIDVTTTLSSSARIFTDPCTATFDVIITIAAPGPIGFAPNRPATNPVLTTPPTPHIRAPFGLSDLASHACMQKISGHDPGYTR